MTNNSNSVKYFFLGNTIKKEIIGEISLTSNSKISETSKNIFKKQYTSKNTNLPNKIVKEEGVIYTKISIYGIFYLGLFSEESPEKSAFKLIEEIEEDNIHLLVNQKGILNDIGKNTLSDKMIQYNSPKNDKIIEITEDINEINIEMKDNIKNNIGNSEDLNSLAVKIKNNANTVNKDGEKLPKKTFFKKYKWNLIMSLILIGILLFIFVPIFNGDD